MKKNIFLLFSVIILVLFVVKCDSNDSEEETSGNLTVFNEILFYDGYAETVDEPVPDGVIRVRNSRYSKQIPTSFAENIDNILVLEVVVKSGCDNYDRIGGVFLSMINKGEAYSEDAIVDQIEIARFITPFMDKNKSPREVPYFYELNNIAKLLKDSNYSDQYDFWLELDIFGVPYAANQQIEGCAGECYTFYGTVKLNTAPSSDEVAEQYLAPVANYEYLNNYNHTDEAGKTVRSFTVNTDAAIKNAKLYLITSNHGANSGGEEYSRRDHYVYFDDNLVSVYKPGGKSCEPYRYYNTQRNGIYGDSKRSDSDWASWSNWCPGDVIPNRVYDLGDLAAGTHTFRIEVPDARFAGQQGEIPVSAYVQGDAE